MSMSPPLSLEQLEVRSVKPKKSRSAQIKVGQSSDGEALVLALTPQKMSELRGELDNQTPQEPMVDLTSIATDSMKKDTRIEVNNHLVERRPDGRACKLCGRKDDLWDPVILWTFHQKRYILWGRPCGVDGSTWGVYCFYCSKFYASRIKKAGDGGISISNYETSLGKSQAGLTKHVASVNAIIWQIILRGRQMGMHIDWNDVERHASLSIIHSVTDQVIGGAEAWLSWKDHIAEHGHLTDKKKVLGHREWTCKGIEGVRFPKSNEVTFRKVTNKSFERREEVGKTGADMSFDQLDDQYRACGSG